MSIDEAFCLLSISAHPRFIDETKSTTHRKEQAMTTTIFDPQPSTQSDAGGTQSTARSLASVSDHAVRYSIVPCAGLDWGNEVHSVRSGRD